MFQRKEQSKSLEKKCNETGFSFSLPIKEFKENGHNDAHWTQEKNGGTQWEIQQKLREKQEKNQSEMKNTVKVVKLTRGNQ